MTMRRPPFTAALALLLAGCAGSAAVTPEPTPAPVPVAAAPAAPADTAKPPGARQPVAPPAIAAQVGLMPLASTGVTGWRLAHPAWDGRGVIVAILDGGVDAGAPGLQFTPTGDRKILDLRDFSDEGRVTLTAGTDGIWRGTLREIRFGGLPQADLNGDGDNGDAFAVEVRRDSSGWAARLDLDGDGALDEEAWQRDFRVRGETFTFASRWAPRGQGPITAALNLTDEHGQPALVVYLDNSGHGTHVAAIATGYRMFGVSGFDGVAPGARILGLKIADNSRGGVTTTGSMLRAMEYAVSFARDRGLPLVMNMSFGVGNAEPGRAVMDSIVDDFLLRHPDVVFTIAAGNDGPGTGTTGQPGSAALAIGVGATYPASFAAVQFGARQEVLGWWSSRGGHLAKPDIVAPGLAFAAVPRWDTGGEVKGGTSMAAPHIAGLAALLVSAARQSGRSVSAAQVLQALRVSARALPGAGAVDQGPGLPDVTRAWAWLERAGTVPRFRVRYQATEIATVPRGLQRPAGRDVAPATRSAALTGAFRPNGLVTRADTIHRFRVSVIADPGIARRARTFHLRSDAAWLRPAQATVTLDSLTGSGMVEVRWDAAAFAQPGRYAGAVIGTAADDSAMGPLFVLPSTVVVADTAGRIAVRGRRLEAGAVVRYPVRVPDGASAFRVHVAVRDTVQKGTVFLFEPDQRPARGTRSADLGADSGRTVTIVVDADDLVPGVHEIVLQAMPGEDLVYDLDAAATTVAIATGDSGASVAASALPGATARIEQVGAVRDTTVAILGADAALRVTTPVPGWANAFVLEVEVAPDVWNSVTDLALTVYDSSGAQLGNGAMNYPYHRVSADLPDRRPDGYAVTWELFPGFASPTPPARTEARVRLRFEGEPAAPAQATMAGGRLVLPAPRSPLAAPVGWLPLHRIVVGTASDSALVSQLVPARPRGPAR
jgi:subtilisin family serine protease